MWLPNCTGWKTSAVTPQNHTCVYFIYVLSHQKCPDTWYTISAAGVNMLKHYNGGYKGEERSYEESSLDLVWSQLGGRMLLSSAVWTDGSHPFSVRSSTCRTLPTVSRLSVWIAQLLPEVIFTGHHTGGARGWDFYWQGHVQSARITSQHKPNPFLMDFWYILHTWWSRMLMHNAFARV